MVEVPKDPWRAFEARALAWLTATFGADVIHAVIRPQVTAGLTNDATERAFRTCLEAVGKQTTRANELALQARKALSTTDLSA